jgi:LL-diaminopimelate aminotransferase
MVVGHVFNYIWFQISRRKLQHIDKYPNAEVISLGVGDTTQPLPDIIVSSMAKVF